MSVLRASITGARGTRHLPVRGGCRDIGGQRLARQQSPSAATRLRSGLSLLERRSSQAKRVTEDRDEAVDVLPRSLFLTIGKLEDVCLIASP